MGEARRAARNWVHAAELGVRQREQENRDRADTPRNHCRRTGRRERALGAEQPARADDRAPGGPQEADEPDLAPETRPREIGPPRRLALDRDLRGTHGWTTAFGRVEIRPTTERRQSRTDLPTGYAGVPVLKTGWATGPGRSAAHDMSCGKPHRVVGRASFGQQRRCATERRALGVRVRERFPPLGR